jgi:RND family efflux transporter MFP subunit
LIREAEAELRRAKAGARPEEIEQATQDQRRAQAEWDAAKLALDRAKKLHAQDAIAKADVDAAQTRYDVAATAVESTGAALRLLKRGPRPEDVSAAASRVDSARAEFRYAQTIAGEIPIRANELSAAREQLHQAESAVLITRAQRGEFAIIAPFDARVMRLPIEPGKTLSPGETALSLMSTVERWVEAEVLDEDAAKIGIGQIVTITSAAFPGKSFEGRIFEMAPRAEPKPGIGLRTNIVRTKIRLADGKELIPGQEVDVSGTGRIRESAITVPSDAVVLGETENFVYVVEDDTLHKRTVKIGAYTYEFTEVVSGLSEGDRVVVSGKDGLKDRQTVKVKE